MSFSGLFELIICQVSLTCIQRITVLVSHRKFRKMSRLHWQNPHGTNEIVSMDARDFSGPLSLTKGRVQSSVEWVRWEVSLLLA